MQILDRALDIAGVKVDVAINSAEAEAFALAVLSLVEKVADINSQDSVLLLSNKLAKEFRQLNAETISATVLAEIMGVENTKKGLPEKLDVDSPPVPDIPRPGQF